MDHPIILWENGERCGGGLHEKVTVINWWFSKVAQMILKSICLIFELIGLEQRIEKGKVVA